MVWLLGCLIKNNTYSYTRGSAPEHVEEKMKDVFYHYNAKAEGKIFPWLDRGFKSVREAEPYELTRWKYGLS